MGLLILLDMSLPEPWESLRILRNEVLCFSSHLSKRPQIIVANKMDCEGSDVSGEKYFCSRNRELLLSDALVFLQDNLEELIERCKRDRIIAVSAKHGHNLGLLLTEVRKIYDQQQDERQKQISSDQDKASDHLA